MTNVIEEQLDQNELYKLPNFDEQIALTDQDSQNIIENIKSQDMEPSLLNLFQAHGLFPAQKNMSILNKEKN